MIEPLAFAEIGIAHAAGIPWTESVTLIVTREPRATVRDSLLATGARIPGRLRPPGRLAGAPARLARPGNTRDVQVGRWRIVARD